MSEWDGVVAVFACSHRAGGNSAAAAELAARGAREAGADARILTLRDYRVLPCRACLTCAVAADSACVLRELDQAEELFAVLAAAPAVVFASPIYFYGLPSLLMTWIDRGQRFWEARRKNEAWVLALRGRRARACFCAGQASGEKLFEGARLALKYFLVNFNLLLEEPLGLRGMDAPGDLSADAGAVRAVLELGRAAGRDARRA